MPVWSVTDWLALVKVIITVVKYIPQICLNFRRKNTIGMAIWQFNLDILGGVLAVGQVKWNDIYSVHRLLRILYLPTISMIGRM